MLTWINGRHTHLIQNYSEAEKALEQAGDLDTASETPTPVLASRRSKTTRTEPIRMALVTSRKDFEADKTIAEGNSDSSLNSEESLAGRTSSRLREKSKETNKTKQDAKEKDKCSSRKSKKRSAVDDDHDAGDSQEAIPKKKRKKKSHGADSAETRKEEVDANETATVLHTPSAVQPRPHTSNGPLRTHGTTSMTIPTAPASMRNQPFRRQYPITNNRRHQDRGWAWQGGHSQPRPNGGDMRWMDDVLQEFKRGITDALKHEIGLG